MTAPVFVDTNVFVYARQSNERVKQPLAAQWIEQLWQNQLGRTSVQVLSELYVSLTHKIRPAPPAVEAWDEVRSLLTWDPQETNAELLARAREVEQRYRLSWWDSLIVAAAQFQDCAVLLTEDLQHGMDYGGVTARNPFVLGVSEAPVVYKAKRVAAPAHPRRGRPRRKL